MSMNDMADQNVNLSDEKLRAEITKMIAETGQVKMQTLLAPFLAAAGVIGATAAVVKLFF
ncbi:hypothetical protein [Yoonia vestfoldensis]|jgi:hypothetical protein|uniref:Uncharacterized protein n=1 Tax=Yoonia vestfoldensis TaxID=245188 RepID=A0A1Y0E7I9_9RHOB|nr:hypothetical protein [Yoonia vestfoldensis]ART99378.1 hypothetical protein LOKVESSMR4R_00030 [Yoonia vestfoldensis]